MLFGERSAESDLFAGVGEAVKQLEHDIYCGRVPGNTARRR